MLVKGDLSQRVLFDPYFAIFRLLRPEEGNRTSYLNIGAQGRIAFEVQYQFGLDEVRHVSMLVYAPSVEASACHALAST